MDLLTIAVMTAVVVALAARVVEIATRRPDAFAAMLEGAQRFAEGALAESAVLRAHRIRGVPQPAREEAVAEERPRLAA